MPRGMTHCGICGKPIPTFYVHYHEKYQCIVGRKQRGEYIEPKALRRVEKERERKLKEEHEKNLNSSLAKYFPPEANS